MPEWKVAQSQSLPCLRGPSDIIIICKSSNIAVHDFGVSSIFFSQSTKCFSLGKVLWMMFNNNKIKRSTLTVKPCRTVAGNAFRVTSAVAAFLSTAPQVSLGLYVSCFFFSLFLFFSQQEKPKMLLLLGAAKLSQHRKSISLGVLKAFPENLRHA